VICYADDTTALVVAADDIMLVNKAQSTANLMADFHKFNLFVIIRELSVVAPLPNEISKLYSCLY
jgi:hypothetical protein